ncbi:MAG: T9SS type A sorting domain-containing protein [Bacteroidia bacterium]|nr:T9SS type A sorting domain-containing protein [Bacteroidia bacterium]
MNFRFRMVVFSLLVFVPYWVFAGVVSRLAVESAEGKIRISWEVNSDFSFAYEVERSDDGKFFSTIYRLPLLMEISAVYSVDDENATPGVNYFYRIGYKDEDGRQQYSEIVSGIVEKERLMVGEFYPNPTYTGYVSVEMRALENCEVSLTVISTQGKELFSGKQTLSEGDHVLDLNFPQIPPGIYFVKMETTEWIQFKGFVVE